MSKINILNIVVSLFGIVIYMIVLFRILVMYEGEDLFIVSSAFIALIGLCLALLNENVKCLEEDKEC